MYIYIYIYTYIHIYIHIYIYIYISATVPLARSGVSLMYLIVPWTPGPLDSEIPKGLLGARTQIPRVYLRPLAGLFFDHVFDDFSVSYFFLILVPTWFQLGSQLGPKTWTDENGKQLFDFIFCGMLETVCNCFLFCFAFLFLLVAGWLLLAASGCCWLLLVAAGCFWLLPAACCCLLLLAG